MPDRPRSYWRIIFLCLLVLVTWLTLTPSTDDLDGGMDIMRWISSMLVGTPEWGDKIAHLLAYAALGGSAAASEWGRARVRMTLALGLAIYGFGLEALQGLGQVREMSLHDGVANALGAIVGTVSYPLARMTLSKIKLGGIFEP